MTLVVPFEEIFENETKLLAKHGSWERVELGEVCEVLNGFAFKSSLFNNSEGFPVIRIRNLARGRTETFYNGDYPREYLVENGDLLVGMDGNFGCYEWGGGMALLNQRVCKLIPCERYLDRKFLLFGINGYLKAIQEATSSMTVGHLSSRDIQRIPFPFPSLNEQRRVVAKLEKLLSRVDATQTRLDMMPRMLRRFRQSVLDAAITGKLTARWRNTHSGHSKTELRTLLALSKPQRSNSRGTELTEGHETLIEAIPEGWATPSLDDLFRFIDYRGKTPKKSKSGKRLVSAKNIKMGYISDEPIEYVSENFYRAWMTRGFPKRGDIFFVTEGHTMGFAALNNREDEFALSQRTITLQPWQLIETRCFLFFIMSSIFQNLVRLNATGSAAVGIKAAKFRGLPIPFPRWAEQQEIVRRVEALFKTADALEARYRTAKAHVDKLTQSILAKAFRGELVPQDPNDEPAAVLLNRIRQGRNDSSSRKKGRGM